MLGVRLSADGQNKEFQHRLDQATKWRDTVFAKTPTKTSRMAESTNYHHETTWIPITRRLILSRSRNRSRLMKTQVGLQLRVVLLHMVLPVFQVTPMRRVRNACAACLTPYEVGESVVWSDNNDSPHAFHYECIVGWLSKTKQKGAPCLCCRQEFISSG